MFDKRAELDLRSTNTIFIFAISDDIVKSIPQLKFMKRNNFRLNLTRVLIEYRIFRNSICGTLVKKLKQGLLAGAKTILAYFFSPSIVKIY